MSKSSLISSIYQSRLVILELLEMQNYDISNYKGIDINEINTLHETSMLDIIVEKNNNEDILEDGQESKGEPETSNREKMYVHYYYDGKISQTKIQNLIDELYVAQEILTTRDGLLIIIDSEPNETINNFVHHIWEKDGIFVIVQSLKRLQFNVLKHELQPKFKILTEKEADIVRRKYNIMFNENCPELSRFDPVCKATFIRPGQMFEIIRPSKTSLYTKYYRICISIST